MLRPLVSVALAVVVSISPLALRTTAADVRPNVLIVVTDDQPVDSMDAMPATLAWMAGGGTHFPKAYVSTPLCCPSRASLMSGRYPQNHHVRRIRDWNRFNHRRSIQHELKTAGYRTGFVGKMFAKWPIGRRPPHFQDFAVGWGYSNAQYNVQGRMRTVDYGPKFDFAVAKRFVRHWDNRNDDRPWYMYVSPAAPHSPYEAQRAFRKKRFEWTGSPATREAARGDKPPYVRRSHVSHREGKRTRTRQLRTLRSVDRGFDRLMTSLVELGELDNTIVIFTSDHGYFWGDHGLKHKHAPYDRAVRVPFYVRGPGIAPGAVSERLTINTDVAPTIFAKAGVTPSYVVDGKDLFGPSQHEKLLLQFKEGYRRAVLPPTWASFVTHTYQYTRYYDGKRRYEEYYDLVNDPYQLQNLVASGYDVPDGLTAELNAARRCAGTSCP